ncbi:hypothetical protein J3R83DRAFT_1020 [Lanmaoa asiatica]|nr:hypothetical protein J3R83DRAFT_1020 [Lanmaoa asiatica]
MNLARHSITPTDPVQIFNAQFDADCQIFTASTPAGFAVYQSWPLRLLRKRGMCVNLSATFTGGTLAAVVPCHTSSLLFLLGGGRSPLYPPNKVILWDDAAGVEVAELEFRERVRGIVCRRGWLAVALRRRVIVFEVNDTVARRAEYDTCPNPRGGPLSSRMLAIQALHHLQGILAMATAAYATLLAIPGRQMGHVQLVHLPPCVPPVSLGPPPSVLPSKPPPPPLKHPVSMIAAHESALTTLSLPPSGRFLATTSSRGTLVRIWDTTSGKLLREFRRGADTAEIYGVAFRPDEKEVGVWSDKGTVHVFSLVSSGASNRQSSLSPLAPFLPLPKYFDSEWSYAQYRIPTQAAHISLSSTSSVRSSHTDIAADEKCVVGWITVTSELAGVAPDFQLVVLTYSGGWYRLALPPKGSQASPAFVGSPPKSPSASRQRTSSISSVASLPEKGKGKEREKERKGSLILWCKSFRSPTFASQSFTREKVYQRMIDRGWRRSGSYCYAPDLRRSCCPQYTIKLDALAFKPSRSQRKLLNRWNRFVRDGGKADETPEQSKQKGSHTAAFCLISSIHSSERAFLPAGEEPRHDFQVTLERSSYTDEKYALYVAYQTEIHHDDDNTPRSFGRFLVQSPLVPEAIPYQTPPPRHLPSQFGSYHQMYRLDGELIAVGVLDILPGCVSSVYFVYNAKWEKYSLGKVYPFAAGHTFELLAREMHDAGLSSLDALYMGFYIHSCPKMKYKGEYTPSFLADPEDFTWHPLDDCVELLDKYRYAAFSQPSHSLAGPDDPGEVVEVDNEEELASEVRSIYSIQSSTVSLVPATMSLAWKVDYTRQEMVACIRALDATFEITGTACSLKFYNPSCLMMTDFAGYLDSLTTSRGTGSDLNAQAFVEWTSPKAFGHDDGLFQFPEDDTSDEPWSTVLDLFVRDIELPFVKTVLVDLLSSSRTDDEISSEVAELVGFDQIELVTDLLGSRRSAAKELSHYLDSRKDPEANGTISQSSMGISVSLAPGDARRRVDETLKANSARPLFTRTAQEAPEVLPHVYTSWSNVGGGSILSLSGSKYMLPIGTTRRDHEDYEEVVVPPAKTVPPRKSERLIPVSKLDALARGSFPVKRLHVSESKPAQIQIYQGYTSLNRIQSIVYPTAYRSNENMLIITCINKGKTDVAMLTILRVLDQHRSIIAPGSPLRASINRDSFKIIYVAPMKALASEIVQKLGKRLKWLSILVRELTGDMQLTKAEIAETQIIVTTPEKWDVVTRKPTGEGELASKLKLLIIDEVHLLNEERGAVIETIVARTLRQQVESSQSVIRIVGLSATLPNYIDVAEFLSVSRYTGLFYFDSSFRPVPLEQHFIGVRGKPGSQQSKRNLDRVTFEKVSELVHQGHQVMVFVHARKETVNAARTLKEAAAVEGTLDDYSSQDHPRWDIFRRNIGESYNKEMKQLFDHGFGIHHAGMLRSDRNLMERMFQERAIKVRVVNDYSGIRSYSSKVLCCTATLAWGVNLPAHAVIIKGTQVYDSGKGSFVDLSVLDVLQVFGRAGRPGLESSGEGYICTTEDKLTHYLDAVASQSTLSLFPNGILNFGRFQFGMVDALNAEIALGTVASVVEGPRILANLSMIDFDVDGNTFTIKDIGRIAAKYYIRHQSIEVFRTLFRAQMTEADVLHMLSKSTERVILVAAPSQFDQIQLRESETTELGQLLTFIPCDVRGGTDTSQGKVNILLQTFISRLPVQDFALVSDTAYVAQNGGRIVRALLEIAISRKWANATTTLMGMSKAVEKRMWPYEEPLRQFNLKAEILHGLDGSRMEYHPAELATLTAAELGNLIRLNEYQGRALLTAAKQFPSLELAYSLRPLGPDMLKVIVTVIRTFDWSPKVHGSIEPFWLWVEDHEGTTILQLAQIFLRESTDSLDVEFAISIPADTLPPSFTIRLVSDKWLGADNELPTLVSSLVLRYVFPLLGKHLSHFREFNAIQTQVFWSLMNTKLNILVAAPASCGKSFLAHIVIWKTLLESTSSSWALIVVPNGNAATKTVSELRFISGLMGVGLECSSGTNLFNLPNGKLIRVITGTNLLESFNLTDPTPIRSHPKIILYENLDQMDASYELGIALTKHATERFPSRSIGLTRSLVDPTDLASWLDVEPMGLHSFLPRDREQPLTCSIQPYTITHSGALFKALAKPVYTAIKGIHTSSGIVFVPAREHCRGVAQDLITQCALTSFSERGFLPQSASPIYVENCLARLRDATLVDFVSRGVGVFHHGISKSDRSLVLELFAEGIIRLLIAPREACWSFPVRAEVVVAMGTQYIQGDPGKSERRLRDYTIGEVVQMQSRAVRQNGAGHFVLFCPAEAVEMFNKFLNEDGLPLESQLLEAEVLERWYQERRRDGTIRSRQDGVDVLSFTFLARRMMKNPTYYGLHRDASEGEALSRIVDGFERS